jgi:hypothetical protein
MLKLIKDFFSENERGSSKRFIGIMIAVILAWGIVFAILKATTDASRQNLVNATMIFILIMSGVATLPQLVSLVRGTPPPKEKEDETTKP